MLLVTLCLSLGLWMLVDSVDAMHEIFVRPPQSLAPAREDLSTLDIGSYMALRKRELGAVYRLFFEMSIKIIVDAICL